MKIQYYEIVIKQYHNEPIARLRYHYGNEIIESNLYSIPEINNILALWRMGKLQGSFGVQPLAENALFQIVQE